jgi:hypothetical protein
MKIYGGEKVQFHTFLTSALDGSKLSDSFLGFTPGKRASSTNWIWTWQQWQKLRPCWGQNPGHLDYGLVIILIELSWKINIYTSYNIKRHVIFC